MKPRVGNILWVLCMVLLLMLCVQTHGQFMHFRRLKNDTKNASKPVLTWQNYKDGSFQQQTETYLSENFALREWGIRLYNQYCFSLWKKTCDPFFYPGSDHWMYYRPGVLDYYGKETSKFFKTQDDLDEFVDNEVGMLVELREILKNDFGIELLTFIAPDKAFVYPEHLPRLDYDTTVGVAAACFAQKFNEVGFPNIDMTSWFQSIADTSSRLLFMPMDTHWTFASAWGYDSLFRFMDHLNGFGIPRMSIDSITEQPYEGRQDDEATLNLMFKVKNDTPAYKAHISVHADSTSRKPKVLFVGDSFVFAFDNLIPKKELTSYYETWFYFDKVFKGFEKREYKIDEINRLRSILNVDYVVVYSVGYQWCRGTDGFAKCALTAIKDPDQVEVALMMNEVEGKPELMAPINEKAQEKGISQEEMLELAAKWIIENQIK